MDKYSVKGGARWGYSFWVSTVASWPLSELTVTANWIELTILHFKKFHFERQAIRGIRIFRKLWSKGIIIEHTSANYPEYIAFGPLQINDLRSNLLRFGYTVTE